MSWQPFYYGTTVSGGGQQNGHRKRGDRVVLHFKNSLSAATWSITRKSTRPVRFWIATPYCDRIRFTSAKFPGGPGSSQRTTMVRLNRLLIPVSSTIGTAR